MKRLIALTLLCLLFAALWVSIPTKAQFSGPSKQTFYLGGANGTEITGTTTTTVKGTAGILVGIAINTPVAGTIGIYDIASAGCSGTPGSGKKASITIATPQDEAKVLQFNMAMANGICLVTSSSSDLTALWF